MKKKKNIDNKQQYNCINKKDKKELYHFDKDKKNIQ